MGGQVSLKKTTVYGQMTHFMPHRKFVHVCKKKERKQVMKKFLTKTGLLGLPQKGLKQVADLQRSTLTSIIHSVQLYGCKCIVLEEMVAV